MKKVYKLLLHIREIEEKQKKKQLADAVSERIKKENEIVELEREKSSVSSGIRESEEGISAWLLAQFLQYIEGLREEKKKKEMELKEAMAVEDEKRKEYIEAKKERDIAGKLVEKRRAQENFEEVKRQEKFSDEFVVSRYRREENQEKK